MTLEIVHSTLDPRSPHSSRKTIIKFVECQSNHYTVNDDLYEINLSCDKYQSFCSKIINFLLNK